MDNDKPIGKLTTMEDNLPKPDEINTYLTVDLDRTITGPDKGQQEEGTYLAFINKDDLGEQVVDLPDELLEKMGWNPGDQIEVSLCENLFDWGEAPGLSLRNLTKERNDENK